MEAKTRSQPITVSVGGSTKAISKIWTALGQFSYCGQLAQQRFKYKEHKRDKKDIQEISESHTNPNLGVTMRGKEILVVTDYRIVVFWDKEVKKRSSYD